RIAQATAPFIEIGYQDCTIGEFLQGLLEKRLLMDRRTFLGTATAAVAANGIHSFRSFADPETPKLKPMALGLVISPYGALEATIKRVRDMGFSNCFLSLDGYIGKFTPEAAK